MIPRLPSPLPPGDLRLLRLLGPLVPASHREEWVRSWAAELWCLHHAPRGSARPSLFFGVVQDALWLRSMHWQDAVRGTPALCLSTLLLLVALSALPAVAPAGSWSGFSAWLLQQGPQFGAESALLLLVSYATAATEVEAAPGSTQLWLKTRVFHLAKSLLVLLLAFLVTADVFYPLQTVAPLTAEFLQTMSFALGTLLGLRWSQNDDLRRCRHCLCPLSPPERIGRPSHNFLEWNGDELACPAGHGRLSVPELETSWCRARAWVAPHRP